MNKKNGLIIALDVLFPIIFNVLFFLLGEREKTGAEWTAYAFIHVAYLAMVFIPYILPVNLAATVIGMPIQTTAIVYFIITLVFGIVIFIVNPEKIVFTVAFEIILFGLFAALVISALLANEHTKESQAVHQQQVGYIKEISARIKALSDLTDDERTLRLIERLYDAAHTSPTKTTAACLEIEREIVDAVSGLEAAVYQADENEIMLQAKQVSVLLNKRNRMLQAAY